MMTWFIMQPPYSIRNFTYLSTKFLTQFSTSQAQKPTTKDLFNVRQKQGEVVKVYMARFNKLSMHMEDLNPDICVTTFKHGLRAGPLNNNLSWQPAQDMTENTRFILMEEHDA